MPNIIYRAYKRSFGPKLHIANLCQPQKHLLEHRSVAIECLPNKGFNRVHVGNHRQGLAGVGLLWLLGYLAHTPVQLLLGFAIWRMAWAIVGRYSACVEGEFVGTGG